jgi:hypothetical protein
MHPESGREPPTKGRTPVKMQHEIETRVGPWKPVIQRNEWNVEPERKEERGN